MIYLYAFFVLTLINALKDIAIKKWLQWVSVWAMTWVTSFILVLLSIPFVIIEGIPSHVDANFIWIVLGWWVFFYFGKYFSFTALSLWDISLISPLKWLVSVSAIFSSMFFLGEWVSIGGGIGITLIVLGTYLLALEKTHTHVFAPIKALFLNPGSRFYLITIILYGFTVTFDRMGVQGSSIWIWTLLMNTCMTIMNVPDVYKERHTIMRDMKIHWKVICLILLLHVVVYISQMYIVSHLISPYTSAFKAASSLFVVMLWGWFFHEKDLFKRFLSAVIIFFWVVCIGFFG